MIPLLLLLAVAGLMQAARSFSGVGMTDGTELAFGFLLLAAYFTGRLANRAGLPKLTGYLLAGVLAGPFVLDLVTVDMTGKLSVVNGVATCILGLVAGSELNFKRVRPIVRTLRRIQLFAVVGVMFVLFGVVFLIRPLLPMFDHLSFMEGLAACIVLGVALVPQSPAIMIALISETRSEGPLSQLMLASVVVADLVVILAYALAAAGAGAMIGGGVDVARIAMSVSWELLGSVAFGIAVGAVIGVFLRSVKQGASMFALLNCIVVAQLGTKIHLDPLVVMLAAGIWLENFSRADASSLIHGFETAQLPVFLVWFALSGSKLDVAQLAAMAIPVLILGVARAGWFFVSCRAACASTDATPAVSKLAWIGLIPQAGLSLALIVVVPKNFPTFGPDIAVILLGLVGLNQIVAPVMLRIALIKSGEAGKKSGGDFAAPH